MAYQGAGRSLSSPSSDKPDIENGIENSPYTTGFGSAGSQSHRHYHGSLAAHYSCTHGTTPTTLTTSPTTATDKQVQRQRIIDHVNAFLRRYEISKVVTDVQQCTSSLFVLLYQRFFNCTIQGIEQSPNTSEKKRRNVQLVLEELEKQGYDMSSVEADEVVRLNEDHISRLVMVFVRIAEEMRQQEEAEEMRYLESAAQGGALMSQLNPHVAGYAPYGGEAGLGYTVAEVTRRPAAAGGDEGGASGAEAMNGGHDEAVGGGASFPHLVVHDAHGHLYDPTGHPHHQHHYSYGRGHSHPRAGAATGSYHDEDVDEEEAETRSGLGSYMVDTSVMPTDTLLEEWYRDLETPAAGEGSLNLSYPTTELRSLPDSRRGDDAADGGASPGAHARKGPHRGTGQPHPHPHQYQQGGYADALNTSDIRQRHRLLNETLDRLDARRAQPSSSSLPAQATRRRLSRPATNTSTSTTTALGSYHSGIGSERPAGPPARRRAPPPGSLPLEEPPLTRAESRLLASHPYRQIDSEYRDRKIERLRAARFLAGSQDLIRQRMRRQYDDSMADMRRDMKSTIAASKHERLDRMRQIRDENERYRRAYETLMESAANDVRVPRYMMSRHTAELAEYFADSLHESHRMRDYLEAERARRNRADVMRYAESVTAWQRQAYV